MYIILLFQNDLWTLPIDLCLQFNRWGTGDHKGVTNRNMTQCFEMHWLFLQTGQRLSSEVAWENFSGSCGNWERGTLASCLENAGPRPVPKLSIVYQIHACSDISWKDKRSLSFDKALEILESGISALKENRIFYHAVFHCFFNFPCT